MRQGSIQLPDADFWNDLWNVVTNILLFCGFTKYAIYNIFHAAIIYINALILPPFALFIQCKESLEMYF